MPYGPEVVELQTLEVAERFELADTHRTGVILGKSIGSIRVRYDKQFVTVSDDYPINIGCTTKVIPLSRKPPAPPPVEIPKTGAITLEELLRRVSHET